MMKGKGMKGMPAMKTEKGCKDSGAMKPPMPKHSPPAAARPMRRGGPRGR